MIDARSPAEILDTGYLSQYVTHSDNVKPISGREVDTITTRISERPQQVEINHNSQAGAAYGGAVPGGYSAHFNQTWEIPTPTFWSVFSRDYVLINFDAVITFGPKSWLPDVRATDKWVWTIDASEVLANALPTFTHFRAVDSKVWRFVGKIVGQYLGGNHILRFGFNLNAHWQSGQFEETEWLATINTSAHVITSAIYSMLKDSSIESSPLSMTHSFNERLDLLTSNADEFGNPSSPTEWALL